MSGTDFFDGPSEQSQVKARIVSKYFGSWADVIKGHSPSSTIAYIELFAGTGRYKDGTPSTPLMVLERIISRAEFRNAVVTVLAEKDPEHYQRLTTAIAELPGIEGLAHQPQVHKVEVGPDLGKLLKDTRLMPSFVFIDPHGYKGLSLDLVNAIVKDWGCECVFFFNYNRVNPGLSNQLVDEHMDRIFGKERTDDLRSRLVPSMTPHDRERCILDALNDALTAAYGRFVLLFRFEHEKRSGTSHYLTFVSKNQTGYEIMKEIMAKESSSAVQGVPSFEYSMATLLQPILVHISSPLDQLKESLCQGFARRTVTMEAVYHEHNVGTPYIKKNYKDALLQLEDEGWVDIKRRSNRPGTVGDKAVVMFPSQE